MKIGAVVNNDLANGPGIRTSIFVSGCPHHCSECHNQELWDFNVGVKLTDAVIEKINDAIAADGINRGVSILGGEPLSVENMPGVLYLITKIKERFPDINIWLWSGYTYDVLSVSNSPYVAKILKKIDTLVDGPFVKELRAGNHPWRGSSNQKIYTKNSNGIFVEVEDK